MKLITRFLAALTLLAAGAGAHAATYYISDCQAGAPPSVCVAGNNANWPTLVQNPATPAKDCGFLTSHYAALQPGDRILFAKGGSITGCSMAFLDNANVVSKAGRIYIGSYTPAWDYTLCTYTSGPKASWVATPCELPLIQSTATVFWFGENNAGGAVHQRYGPIIDGLHLKGNSSESGVGCLRFGGGSDYAELKNSELESCYNGVEAQVNMTYSSIASGNAMADYTWIHDNYIHDVVHNGFFGAAQYLVLNKNIFDKCGNTRVFDHCIYIGGMQLNSVEQTTYGLVVQGNVSTSNTYFASAGNTGLQCESVILVIHGLHDGLTIEGNDLIEDAPPSGTFAGNCYGIGPAPGYDTTKHEGFFHTSIRWNRIVNVAACIMADSMHHSLIENNTCYTTYNGATNGISSRSGLGAPYDKNKDHATNLVVRNNSLYFTLPSANITPLGFKFNEWDGAAGAGSGNVVVSNLVYLGTGTSSTTNCLSRVGSANGAVFSVTVANPGVFTFGAHGLATNQPVYLTGTVPGGFVVNTVYYPVNVTADTWQLAATPSGTGIQATSTGSSTTVKHNYIAFTNGSSTATYVAHGLVADQQVQLTNTPGTLPSGFTSGNWYYVKAVLGVDTVTLSATKGGTAIVAGANGSGSIVRATAPGNFLAMDRNLCYFAGTAGVWDTPTGSLANWITASGLDVNSITGSNPNITAPSSPTYSLCPGAGAAIGAGHLTLSSEFAYRGFLREGTPDIGACQTGASKVVPYSPAQVH